MPESLALTPAAPMGKVLAGPFIRLFFQPVLIGVALWSTGAWDELRGRDD